MLTTHVATYFIVLGGPISRRTAGHSDLRHLETVRHDFFTHTPSHTHMHTRVVFSVAFVGLDADAKKRCMHNIFILLARSFQYWTLNPGQEATEPKMSPRDPMRIIRAEGRSMDNSAE